MCTFPTPAALAVGHRTGRVPGSTGEHRTAVLTGALQQRGKRWQHSILQPLLAWAASGALSVQCNTKSQYQTRLLPGSSPLSPREVGQPSQLPPQHPLWHCLLRSPRFPNFQLFCCKRCCSSTRVKLSKQHLLEFSTSCSDIYPTYLIYLSEIIKRFQIPFYLFRLDSQFQTRYLSCASWFLS